MSTRSRIAIKQNKVIKSVYCHYDGYPEYNGKLLLEHYTNVDKINQLIELGDLSFLAPEIGTFNDFDNSSKDYCCFYNRDRGEKDVNFIVSNTKKELINHSINSWCDFVYLFDNNQWYCAQLISENNIKFKLLND
jgi:hypothetical protein